MACCIAVYICTENVLCKNPNAETLRAREHCGKHLIGHLLIVGRGLVVICMLSLVRDIIGLFLHVTGRLPRPQSFKNKTSCCIFALFFVRPLNSEDEAISNRTFARIFSALGSI